MAILFFITGFSLRPLYERYTQSSSSPLPDPPPRGIQDRLGSPQYKFIDPLLACEVADQKAFVELQPLNDILQKQVQTEINRKNATKISIYFRSMSSGQWASYQENHVYPGGSLIKIPFLIAYYQMAANNPKILEEVLTYRGEFDQSVGQKIPPVKKLEVGKSYSVSELIRRMVIYSSNNSTVLLMQKLDRSYLNTVFDDLNVSKDQDVNRQWLVTTKTFAYFFRILYNATYLNRTMSENALKLLAETTFKEGLVAGVPEGINVSHKFGEHTLQYLDGTAVSSDLHDCGIIYHAAHPYFLCVMAEGTSFEPLKGVIARISKAAYTFVDNSPSHLAIAAS